MRNEIKSAFGGKKLLKIIGTSTLAVAMALTLTGCGTATTAKPNQVVVWGFVDEDVFKPIIKDFQSSNKGITVKYYKKTLDANYEDAALNSILSDQGPDVWAIPNDWVYRHKDKLAAAPDTLLKSKKLVPKDYFSDFVLSDNAFDNQIFGMPPTSDVLQVYYNPEIFNSATAKVTAALKNDPTQKSQVNKILNNFPVTWAEFDQIIPWLTTKSGNNISVAGAAIGTSGNVTNSADILSLLMLQNQTKILSDDLSQATFNLPVKNSAGGDVYAGKNSLDFYSKYADPSNPAYTWNSSMPNDVDAFVQGKVGMIFSYSNLATFMQQVYPKFSFKRGLIPQVGDLNPIIDLASYTSFVVPDNSVVKDLAWQFVVGLATEQSSTYKSATKELSAKRQTGVTPELKSRTSGGAPTDQIAVKALTFTKGRYPVELDREFMQAIDRVNARAQNSQASLDTAAANETELLRRTTW